MKSLKAFALLFVLTALPVSAEIGPDGTGVVNGYQIGPDANLSDADLRDTIWNTPDPRIAELETQLAAAIAERDERPTQEAYDGRVAELTQMTAERDTAIHERDERPTLEQMQDARVGSVLLAADVETNEVTLNFKVEQTNDLTTWKPFSNVSLYAT